MIFGELRPVHPLRSEGAAAESASGRGQSAHLWGNWVAGMGEVMAGGGGRTLGRSGEVGGGGSKKPHLRQNSATYAN